MTRVAVEFEELFKVDSEADTRPKLASHRGGAWDAAVLLDKHARAESLERPYIQQSGNFAALFGSRRASVLFAKSVEFRQRLLNAMGESAGDNPLLCAFLSGDEAAARREIRRAAREDFPAVERFQVPAIDPGPKDDEFDDFDFFLDQEVQ